MRSKPDLSVELSGLRLNNPVILSSGPLTENGALMKKAAGAGAGAAMTRTMYLEPGRPLEWINCGPGSLMNTGGFSSLGLKPWVEKEIKIAKEGGIPVMASIVNPRKNLAEIKDISSALEKAGADLLVMATSAEREFIIGSVKAAKEVVRIPVYAKMGFGDGFGELSKNIGAAGKAAEDAGADGIVAVDTVASVSKIDVNTGQPIPRSLEDKVWRLSGTAIHPSAVYCVAKLARTVKIPIIGTGGIMNGEDAVEMMMAGASAIGICTVALLEGPSAIRRIKEEISSLLLKRNVKNMKEIVGSALESRTKIQKRL
jgi:dihydroorotate dehydrogenase (NAD+) catalytic subunit